MAQEIELKFIVNHSAVEALRDHLNTLGGEHHDPVQLLNIYYETPDNWLRGHDMGLRIRGENGRYEMTMKVAGRVMHWISISLTLLLAVHAVMRKNRVRKNVSSLSGISFTSGTRKINVRNCGIFIMPAYIKEKVSVCSH